MTFSASSRPDGIRRAHHSNAPAPNDDDDDENDAYNDRDDDDDAYNYRDDDYHDDEQ